MLNLSTRLRDCLFLNWACPIDEIVPPELPEGMRLDTRRSGGRSVWLVSAVLFRQDGLRLRSLPFLRFSHPQANLRTYVIDADDQPAVFFLGMWVPFWVAPGARLIAGQPAEAARFSYPPSPFTALEPGFWSVETPCRLRARVEQGANASSPVFASWEARSAFLRERPFGYVRSSGAVSRITARSTAATPVPVRATMEEDELVRRALGAPLPALESAMLYPEIEFVFELGRARALAVPQAAPAPV